MNIYLTLENFLESETQPAINQYPELYYFDINRRVYIDDNGNKTTGPIYSKHFGKLEVVGETPKKFITNRGDVSKNTMKLPERNGGFRVFTKKEMEDDIIFRELRPKMAHIIQYSTDIEKLNQIKEILGL